MSAMPRNVVVLSRRLLTLPTRKNREAQLRVEQAMETRFRARRVDDPPHLEIDFPKRYGGRAAKNDVATALNEIEPRWRRLFVLYPTESSLRDHGE